ncbi:hypothetical protein SAMN05444401_3782 [Clostridium amylolyticum]|uniref:Uncharacterized protein n=1 Tax=Clostridium amylolyticum TaxID=1121298 RepID=A0A1M6LTY3_9CLOT|nr:hypothetical protein SAMN05444401_3782 [Clostridium amylolyticum]
MKNFNINTVYLLIFTIAIILAVYYLLRKRVNLIKGTNDKKVRFLQITVYTILIVQFITRQWVLLIPAGILIFAILLMTREEK